MTRTSSSSKPVFLVTHPRACSTAFERVFLTRHHDIACVHEPFSNAYHWGPEKQTERYEDVEKLRAEKGLQDYTYRAAFKTIEDAKSPGKRVFVKDMAKCLMPLRSKAPYIVPSLRLPRAGHSGETSSEEGIRPASQTTIPNPTVVQPDLLSGFCFAFLIRNPRWSIPSLYECSTPPKSWLTGWHGFKAEDAGYSEMRTLFDYLMRIGQMGPSSSGKGVCVVDADDLLTHPDEVLERFCASVSLPFDRAMLQWGTEKDQLRAEEAFKDWAPFHDAVLRSTSLKPPRFSGKNAMTPEQHMAEWTRKYGEEGAAIIQKNVEDNMPHYLYLKAYAIRPNGGL